jgi:hypothetical protein
MANLVHLTLNTGHSASQPAESIGAVVVEILRPMVKAGGGPIPGFAPFRVTITRTDGGAMFTVWRGQEPVITAGLAWAEAGQDEVWCEVEALYLRLSDTAPGLMAASAMPDRPRSLPWLGVVLLPQMLKQRHTEIFWLGEFERLLAWVIMKEGGGSQLGAVL